MLLLPVPEDIQLLAAPYFLSKREQTVQPPPGFAVYKNPCHNISARITSYQPISLLYCSTITSDTLLKL